jgi:PilZ domain
VRSSGRIPKEIPIVLIGSDLDGSVFSEPTKTVLLSLHGAGVLSRHKLCAEQEMVLRCPDRNKEAEIRVVGQLGTQEGVHTYGVAFVDPNLKFWDVEFPSLSPAEMERGLLSLVCNSCKTLEKIDDTGIEADICATGEGVLRFCKRCGSSTLWKPAQTLPAVSPESLSPVDDTQMALFPSSSPPEPAPAQPPKPNSSPVPAPASSTELPPAPLAASSSPISAPAQASRQTPSQTQAAVYYEQRGAVLTLSPPRAPDTPRVNRRKHPRVKVSYSACIRHPERGDDIVTCEDMSRGGLRFTSLKSYYERTLIEVAVPYTPGQPAIFVPAQIVFVQELPEQQLFRYGVAYLQLPKPSNSF